MTHSIKNLFHIDASRNDVFKAISTIEGLSKWWTTDTSGSSNQGATIKFRFGGQGPDIKVTSMKADESISWECIESPHGWTGNTLTFNLDENEGKTRVRFSHEGWEDEGDFYAICTFTWGRYMESLRKLLQTGKGEPFGAEAQ